MSEKHKSHNAEFTLHDIQSHRIAAVFTLHDNLGYHSVAAVFTLNNNLWYHSAYVVAAKK